MPMRTEQQPDDEVYSGFNVNAVVNIYTIQ